MKSNLENPAAAHNNESFKCITLIALSNPEPGYKDTRHNAGRLIINNMIDQLTSNNGSEPTIGSMKAVANISLPPGKKLVGSLEKIYGSDEVKKYKISVENFKGAHKRVNYQIFTPTLKRVDGEDDIKTLTFNRNKVSFILAYVDRTAMNINGPKAIEFLKKIPSILSSNVKNSYESTAIIKNFIVADDKDVKLGATQIRSIDSSNRGHNGYHSCQKALNGKHDIEYSKLSIGVGKPPVNEDELYDRMVLADYVLGNFKPEEIDILKTETTEKVWDILLKQRQIK
ncbi:hypothetical protein QEN19_002482 [Hanseniaspora menglaensis]